MKKSINLSQLSHKQKNEIIEHFESRADATTVSNNTLIVRLAPFLGDEAIAVLNEWSAMRNALEDANERKISEICDRNENKNDRRNLQ